MGSPWLEGRRQRGLFVGANSEEELAYWAAAGRLSQRGSLTSRFTFQRACRNLYDSMVIDWRFSSWWYVWEIVAYLVTIFIGFLPPLEVALSIRESSKDLGFQLLDHAIYLIFLADMVFHFFLALPDPDRPSCLVRQPGVIIVRYAKGWLLVDLVSILPYTAVLFKTGVPSHHVRHAGLWRMARLPRLAVRETILRRWQIFFGFSFAALEALEYFIIVAMVCHWMACLWGSLGLVEDDSWLRAMADLKGQDFQRYTDSMTEVYSVGLYLAFMTLTSVGYGDVCPVNMQEYWLSCLCMALSAALWAFIIGEVCRIAASMDPHETRFMRTMDDLNSLLRSRHTPHTMRVRMRTYLYEAREVARQRAQIPIVEQMSPMLQGVMAMHLHRGWLEKVWYLRTIEGQALVNIARRLQSDLFAPNEEVPCNRTLFILRRGICMRRARVLIKGDVWGEDMVLSNRVLRDSSPVKALSYLEVIMLHYTDLIQAVKAFPEVCKQIQRVRVKIALMRAVRLVSRALKDVAFRVDIPITDIAKDLENFVVQEVLTGAIGVGSRKSQRTVLLDHCQREASSSQRDSASEPGQEDPEQSSQLPPLPEGGGGGLGGGRRRAVLMVARNTNATARLSVGSEMNADFVTRSDLQELHSQVAELSFMVNNLGDRRSSRVESVEEVPEEL